MPFKQLYECLTSNHSFTESQSGFTLMFSTETALFEMTKERLLNINSKHLIGVIFLDYEESVWHHEPCYAIRKA